MRWPGTPVAECRAGRFVRARPRTGRAGGRGAGASGRGRSSAAGPADPGSRCRAAGRTAAGRPDHPGPGSCRKEARTAAAAAGPTELPGTAGVRGDDGGSARGPSSSASSSVSGTSKDRLECASAVVRVPVRAPGSPPRAATGPAAAWSRTSRRCRASRTARVGRAAGPGRLGEPAARCPRRRPPARPASPARPSQRLGELARHDPDLVRVALGDLRQRLQVLVGEQRRVRVGGVDRAEHGLDRLGLALRGEVARGPLALGPQDARLPLGLGGEDRGLLAPSAARICAAFWPSAVLIADSRCPRPAG